MNEQHKTHILKIIIFITSDAHERHIIVKGLNLVARRMSYATKPKRKKYSRQNRNYYKTTTEYILLLRVSEREKNIE